MYREIIYDELMPEIPTDAIDCTVSFARVAQLVSSTGLINRRSWVQIPLLAH